MQSRRLLLAVGAQLAILLVWHPSLYAQIYAGPPAYVNEPFIGDGTSSYDPVDDWYIGRPPARFGTAIFDVMLLNRSGSDFADLVTEDGGPVVLTTSDIQMTTEAGFRFQWTCESECLTDFQFAYMGSHSFYRSATVGGTDVRGILFNGTSSDPATSVSTTYKSDLDSIELNLRTRQWRRIAPIVGLRGLQLEDLIEHTNAIGQISAMTDNELYGVHFGFEAVAFQYGPWSLESTVKAGVFYNNLDVMMGSDNINFTQWFHETAFMGDLNVSLRYQWCPRISVRVGYQALWLDGVALIPDQFDNFDIGANPVQGRIDLTTVDYHGTFVGLEATW